MMLDVSVAFDVMRSKVNGVIKPLQYTRAVAIEALVNTSLDSSLVYALTILWEKNQTKRTQE